MDKRPRDVLKANLRALMEAHADLDTIVKVSERSGVSKGVVERMTKSQANTGIDHLGGIAAAFGLEIWQLMVPGLDPGNPPMLHSVAEKQKDLWARFKAAAADLVEMEKQTQGK